MCEVCVLMRTLRRPSATTTTTSGTTTTRTSLLLLPLRALLLVMLLLPLRALLLLLAEGRVWALALDRTELVRVGTLSTMASLTLLPLEDYSGAHIRDGDLLDRSLALRGLQTGEVHLDGVVH